MPEETSTSWPRRLISIVLPACVSLVLLELLARVALLAVNGVLSEPILSPDALVERHRARLVDFMEAVDPVTVTDTLLGWRYRAGYAEGSDTINDQGVRASGDYPEEPSPDVLRVATFGDSFVYCSEVANPDCWSAQLEADGQVEVLNYGVGGYGMDQAYLRYLREGDALDPAMVIIGFAPVDLGRIVNRYRGFVSSNEGPWFKPRFVESDGELRLLPTPAGSVQEARALLADVDGLREVGEMDWWYESAVYESSLYRWSGAARLLTGVWIRLKRRLIDPDRLYDGAIFNEGSTAFRLQLEVGLMFADSVRARGAEPVVILFPSREDVEGSLNGRPASYGPLAEAWRERGLEVVDPLPLFTRFDGDPGELFAPLGHYSRLGYGLIATALAPLE
ncbi:MAG: SGNH/GDSL hydrolase family protein [Gemmatimonadota bacterium]